MRHTDAMFWESQTETARRHEEQDSWWWQRFGWWPELAGPFIPARGNGRYPTKVIEHPNGVVEVIFGGANG